MKDPALYRADCLSIMATLPANSFDLIIVDPPYFETKGEFDWQWQSFEDYLADVKQWAIACTRLLKDNGSLFWWGHAKKLAYTQIIIDDYLNLENVIIWEKKNCQTRLGMDGFRSFAPVTERLLFYSKEIAQTGRELVEKTYVAPRNPFAKVIKAARLEAGLSRIELAEQGHFYGNVNCGGTVINWEIGASLPTPAHWEKLLHLIPLAGSYNGLKGEYETIRADYETIRADYEHHRRRFTNDLKLTDVWHFSQESNETRQHNHPTQKPPKVCEALVRTCGTKDGRALIPFMGSGVEVIACVQYGMDCVGIEKDPAYFDAAKARIKQATKQRQLL